MKNFKKVLALTLALAMVLSTMTVAFASTNDAKAKVLYDLGLFKGTSTTEYVPALDEDADAAQALVLIGRALKWDVDMDATVAFNDVPSWAAPYVAFAVKEGITNGVSDTEFGVNIISGQRVVAWFLRALGYDSTEAWENTAALAETAGINVPATSGRDAVVGVIYEGLMTTPVGEDATLISTIVGDDDDMKDIAVKAGLMDDEPDVLEVVSVKADNLRQIKVEFNKALDKAGDEDDYTLEDTEDYDGDKDDDDNLLEEDSNHDAADFDLSEDGKTVTITLPVVAKAQDDLTLEIGDNILPKKASFDFQFVDTTIPKVLDAEVVGIDVIKVYFSEPMLFDADNSKDEYTYSDNYTVEDKDGDEIYVDEVKRGTNDMTALVYLQADLDGDVSIKVEDVRDSNEYKAATKTIDLDVTVDKTAPKVVGFKDADATEVTLIFDEDIEVEGYDSEAEDPDGGVDMESFYHTNSKNPAKAIDVDGNELTLTFDEDYKMTSGDIHIFIDDEVDDEPVIQDLWNNEAGDISYTINVVLDKEPPVLEEISIESQTEVKLTFDDDISDDTDSDQFTLLDADGDESDDADIDMERDEKNDNEILLTFSKPIFGKYKLKIEDLEDTSDNKADDMTISFEMEDETAPNGPEKDDKFEATLYVESKTKTIVVDFKEEMNNDDIKDLGNYQVGGLTLDEVNDDDDIDVTVINDGEGVEIEISEDAEFDDNETLYADLSVGDKLVIAKMADKAGNVMKDVYAEVTLKDSGSIDFVAEIKDKDTIVITVDDKLTDFNKDKIAFSLGDLDDILKRAPKRVVNDDDETVITYYLENELATTSSAGITVTVSSGAGKNDYGEEIATGTALVLDDAAPEMEKVVFVSSTEIQVYFSEDLDPATFATKGSNGFAVSGGDAEISDASGAVTVSGNVVTIIGEDFSINSNVAYDEAYGITDVIYTSDEDEEANKLESFTETDKLEKE